MSKTKVTAAKPKAKAVKTPVAAKKPLPQKKAVPVKKTVATKKAVAKKAAPAKKVVASKKVVAAKKVVPVKKPAVAKKAAVTKKAAPAKKIIPSKKPAAAKTPLVAKKSASAKPASKTVTTSVKSALKTTTPALAGRADSSTDTAKKSPRAAKAMSMMPPPPGLSVASTMAKASYGPISVPTLPMVVPMIPVKNPKLAHNWKNKTAATITDEEVLAMPDEEYMSALQMAFFRLKLVQLKTDILANASETTEHLREDTVIVPDPTDRATIEEEHALELRTRDRERKLLKKIQQSIGQIDNGDYGYCDETGEPIGVGRLLARPTATLTLEAQQRRELKQKMFGD
ncbi:MAG: RNA polymerase-binding protein DksA [Burkholderiales bacterium]|nr:RNA polymerase-binding protein DksA [Burkholderiales bacterium]